MVLAASYTYTSSGTAERQEHLRAGKFFTCRCARCLDPSELGTHFSSIRCRRCNQTDAMIVSTNPLGKCAVTHFIEPNRSGFFSIFKCRAMRNYCCVNNKKMYTAYVVYVITNGYTIFDNFCKVINRICIQILLRFICIRVSKLSCDIKIKMMQFFLSIPSHLYPRILVSHFMASICLHLRQHCHQQKGKCMELMQIDNKES